MVQRDRATCERSFRISAAVVALAAVGCLLLPAPAWPREALNALVWCDHTDSALIAPFEKANDVKVNLKEYEGAGTAFSIIDQAQPGDWDIMVIDGIDVHRAIDKGIFGEIPESILPNDDIFPEVRMKEKNSRDGKIYAVTEKFGYNAISYDKSKIDPADMRDMSKLWSKKYTGRIAIYDYYLPVMALTGMALGKKTAELSQADLPAMKERLFALKANARQVSDVVSSQTALATGEVDIVFGGGEWLTAGLVKDNPNLDWAIPDQGAVRWTQSIGIVKSSRKRDLALKFVRYIVSPEGQARLATSSCYWAMPANAQAGRYLSGEQKAALRWERQADYLQQSQLYPAPDADFDAKMQDGWTEMLQK